MTTGQYNIKYLLPLLIIIPYYGISQTFLDTVNARIYHRSIHQIELSKQDIKRKVDEWVAKAYSNSKYVTRLNNEDQIITKGSFDVGADYRSSVGIKVFVPRKVDYTLDIEVREGRYKLEITDLNMSEGGMPEELYWYLSDFTGYRDNMRKFLDNYEGIGRKTLLNRVENDNKAMKDYINLSEHGKEITQQIVIRLDRINEGLLKFIKGDSSNDDW